MAELKFEIPERIEMEQHEAWVGMTWLKMEGPP